MMLFSHPVALSILVVFALYIIAAWVMCFLRYCSGEDISFDEDETPSVNMFHSVHNILHMIIHTLGNTVLGFALAILWPLAVYICLPIAVLVYVARYQHKKNKRVKEAVEELRGERV